MATSMDDGLSGVFARLDAAVEQIRMTALATTKDFAARDLQPTARTNAPWHDRGGKDSLTGKTARESLEAEAEIIGTEIVVVLRSTRQSRRPWRSWTSGAPVGAFLELGTRVMHKYAVIRPTMQDEAPRLRDQLTLALGGGGMP